MALKIRLRQQGRNNRPTYRLVVTPVTTRRDGKYIEALGWYDPFVKDTDQSINFKPDRIQYWLSQGAQLTERAEQLVARGAPEVLKQHREKGLALRAKECAKRKARRQKAEG